MKMGHLIRSLRQQRGWTLGQLALYSGVGKSYLSRIERGKHEGLSAKKLADIAKALEVSCDYLCHEVGWHKAKDRTPLPPEVRRLAEVIEGYPPGPAKMQAKQMIRDVAVILQTLAERMEERPVEANEEAKTI